MSPEASRRLRVLGARLARKSITPSGRFAESDDPKLVGV